MPTRTELESIATQWVSLWCVPVDWQLFDRLHSAEFEDCSSAERSPAKEGLPLVWQSSPAPSRISAQGLSTWSSIHRMRRSQSVGRPRVRIKPSIWVWALPVGSLPSPASKSSRFAMVKSSNAGASGTFRTMGQVQPATAPNPSIEGTSSIRLRRLSAAPHVKR